MSANGAATCAAKEFGCSGPIREFFVKEEDLR
jgi:hypothetical protein